LLRRALSNAPVVLETHGGEGLLYRASYADCSMGLVFERDNAKVAALAAQRPTWAVYQADCVAAIGAGVGSEVPVTLLDVDPWGDPWPVLKAFFSTPREPVPQLGVVVNDGLRQKLKLHGGWTSRSMERAVLTWGNDALHDNYLEVCREELELLAAAAGYRIDRWTGYYGGHAQQMTHYAAVLTRVGGV
jgi:hypothetical protein